MSNKVKYYTIVMVIGIILNFSFYEVAHLLHLPVWMDNIGTAYVALILEPAAGLLVAFVSNFYQSAFVYDSSSLIYYSVSAMAALTIGIGMRKQGKITFKRLPIALLCYVVVGTLLAAAITLWRTAGIPDSGWEHSFYDIALTNGVPNVLACTFATFVLKVNDAIVIGIAIIIFYKITPKSWVNETNEVIVSWKNTYFKKDK